MSQTDEYNFDSFLAQIQHIARYVEAWHLWQCSKTPAWEFTTGGLLDGGGGGWLSNQVRSVTMGRRKCSNEAGAARRGEAVSTKTLYEVLGVVAEESSADDIKRAYKKLARRYHPDTNRPEDHDACTRKFLEVRRAYEVLSDPKKKAEYDIAMANPMLAQAFGNSYGCGESFDPWRLQWEAQLSMFSSSDRSSRRSTCRKTWGARMREKKSQMEPGSS